MTEDIVINFEANLSKVEESLDKLSTKMEAVSSKFADGTMTGARDLVSAMRNGLNNETSYHSDEFTGVLSGLSPYVNSKLDAVQSKISSLMDLLSHSSGENFLTSLNQQSALLNASMNDLLGGFQKLHTATVGFTKEQKQIINASIPYLGNSMLSTIRSATGKHGIGAPTAEVALKTWLMDERNQAGVQSLAQKAKLGTQNQNNLFAALMDVFTPSNAKRGYFEDARMHSQGTLAQRDASKYYNNYKDHLPPIAILKNPVNNHQQ